MLKIARSVLLLLAVGLGLQPFAAHAADAKKKIVFIAGGPSHGFFAHDHLAGCKLLAKRINEVPGFEATVAYKAWPKPEELENAAAIVIYCDGGGGHMAIPHKDELKALSAKGVGIGCIHYAVEVPKEKAGQEWLDTMGGYFETFLSINPHWQAEFNELPKHAVANGVKPFTTTDEWYYHMRFREEMKGVRPILSAVPPDKTRQGKDDAHGGNPTVRAGIGKSLLEHVVWVSENFSTPDAKEPTSRGFGCTGGHFHKNWANDQFRKTILNAIVWIAKGEVPNDGIQSNRPDADELLGDRDLDAKNEQPPANFDKAKLTAEIEEMNKPFEPKIVKPHARAAQPGEELLKPVAVR
jgi:type 1 glutamine amidotransferase